MRTIEKGAEPPCLAELRREARRIERETGKPSTGGDWAPKDCGEPIRDALCRDQYGLCAYCMRRIRPRGDAMKIEHFVARTDDPTLMYEWHNLLGVCTGVLKVGPDGSTYTCDTARGDRRLHVHPAKPPPTPEAAFIVERTGKMRPEGKGAIFDSATLNLNADVLVSDRRAVVDALRRKLRLDDDIGKIRRHLKTASTPVRNELPQFARVAIEYLQHKLRARER